MNVKEVVKQRGFTLTEVAGKMGITRVTLMQTLQRNPTIATLRRIADAVGCKVGDFFSDEISLPESQNNFVCPKCGTKLNIIISTDD